MDGKLSPFLYCPIILYINHNAINIRVALLAMLAVQPLALSLFQLLELLVVVKT